MAYRHLVQSPESAVQIIAANYLRHGYYWYVTGRIPAGKDARTIDRKLIEKYGVETSEWGRSHRRKNGLANVQYLRCDDWFILLVTEGHHLIKAPSRSGGEGESVKDFRRVPLKFAGYSISYRRSGVGEVGAKGLKWHAHVRIDSKTYAQLKAHFANIALHRTAESLSKEFQKLPFARFAPIRRQILVLARMVNKKRQPHGYEPVSYSSLGLRRTPVKVYDEGANPTAGGV